MNKWDAEFTVDMAAARKVCAEECGLAPTSIELLGEGWDNTVYLVNKKYVFRFPRREVAVDCLLAELDLVPLVRTSLRTPQFKYSSRKSGVTGRPFAGYELIPGEPAGETALSACGKRALVGPVAVFLKELHATRLPAALKEKRRGEAWRTDVPGRIALARKMFEKCRELGVDLGLVFGELEPYLARVRFPQACALVHGDFYPLHIILNPSRGVAGIIDWGDVHYGSPCQDLSIAFGYFPKELLPAFEAGYGKIPDDWKPAAAFRAFCHGLSLLAFAADKRRPVLVSNTVASIRNSAAWLAELGRIG